jgi:hypothetical protein
MNDKQVSAIEQKLQELLSGESPKNGLVSYGEETQEQALQKAIELGYHAPETTLDDIELKIHVNFIEAKNEHTR